MSKKAKPRIGIDVDGVLVELHVAMLQHMNQRYGTSYTREDIREWQVANLLPVDLHNDFWTSFGTELRVHDTLEPASGAVEGMRKLGEIFEVHIVTSPLWTAPTWTYDRDRWLQHWFQIPYTRIHHTHDKTIFRGNALVDDKPANVLAWANAHPLSLGLLWDLPWNREELPKGSWRRVDSWDAVISLALDPLGMRR